MKFSGEDVEILRRLQTNFPIEERPFRSLSSELGITEDKLIERIREYKANGYVREISPKLVSDKVGYSASTLVAVKVEEDRIEEIAETINEYDGVSLNYERDNDYNLWFTLHASSKEELLEIIDEIKKRTDPINLLNLPKQKQFKLHVVFNPLTGGED
ncbi:hypothetical protein AKJ48_03985 [candidate division MSBL1 archaeon SCGC-AAA261O19]|uniref:siroheme decarboxylase n=1 Tax=candidate division MSBL1 archaeon SCGC-AAA261O19 TaxID=1698277 RepID=A0A133VA73_9EURY|nr:hypothetical protein AKJ48_03985 [candidate division MSBL1 archaeon SCGC-AAA261O19]